MPAVHALNSFFVIVTHPHPVVAHSADVRPSNSSARRWHSLLACVLRWHWCCSWFIAQLVHSIRFVWLSSAPCDQPPSTLVRLSAAAACAVYRGCPAFAPQVCLVAAWVFTDVTRLSRLATAGLVQASRHMLPSGALHHPGEGERAADDSDRVSPWQRSGGQCKCSADVSPFATAYMLHAMNAQQVVPRTGEEGRRHAALEQVVVLCPRSRKNHSIQSCRCAGGPWLRTRALRVDADQVCDGPRDTCLAPRSQLLSAKARQFLSLVRRKEQPCTSRSLGHAKALGLSMPTAGQPVVAAAMTVA